MLARRTVSKPFKRFGSRRRWQAKWRRGRVPNEDRFAAVLVVLMLAALVASTWFAYVIHHH
jgi:hypothetical protein